MYTIEKKMPDGSSTIVKIKSTRNDMKKPSVSYTREGADVTFDFNAENIEGTTGPITNSLMNTVLQAWLSGKITIREPQQ